MSLALKEIHPVAHSSERQLVAAVRQGDDRAFEALFERYRRRISAYVYSLVKDHARAEDITQEVFISALRRMRETDGAISFKPWIYEIARNACIDEFRRVSRASLVSLDVDGEDGIVRPEITDLATPDVRFERKQQIGELVGAFSSLNDNQHRILVLRELEGLSYAEIGQRMSMSRPMVESTLFRARRRLTQEYDELASGRRCLDVQSSVDHHGTAGIATLGLRERRRIARHLHHCPECLRYARMAGVDEAALRVPAGARRVAALLPFGWLRLGWHRAAAKVSPRSALRASSMAEGNPQSVAVGRAAAAAAALLITGGGFTMLATHHSDAHARPAAPATVPAFSLTSAQSAVHQVPYLVAPTSTGAHASSRPQSPVARGRARRASAGHAAAGRRALAGAPATRRSPSTTGAPRSSAPHGSSTAASTVPVGTRVGALGTVLGGVTSPGSSPLAPIITKTGTTVGRVVSTVLNPVKTITTTLTGSPGALLPSPTVTAPGVTVSASGATSTPSATVSTPAASVSTRVNVPAPAADTTVTVPSVKGGSVSATVSSAKSGTTATVSVPSLSRKASASQISVHLP